MLVSQWICGIVSSVSDLREKSDRVVTESDWSSVSDKGLKSSLMGGGDEGL